MASRKKNIIKDLSPREELDIRDIHDKLRELVAAVQEMKETVDYISNQHDDILSKLNSVVETQAEQAKNIEKNKKQIDKLSLENEYLHRQIKKQQEHMNFLDQYNRRENIELHGIDEKPNENLQQIVEDVATALNLPLSADCTVALHRLPKPKLNRNNRPAPIIVRFINRKISERWLEKRKTGITSKNLMKNGSNTPIFINENLTPANKELHWHARVRGKDLKYEFVWIKKGSIYMKKDKDHNAKKINCFDDLPTAQTIKQTSTITSPSEL